MKISIAMPASPESQGGDGVVMRANGLFKQFDGKVVLRGVNLELHEGDVVLLEGENGSGKTTLLNILSGCLSPDSGDLQFSTNGSVRRFSFPAPWWGGLRQSVRFTPEAVARCGVGRTWQDIRLFGSQSLGDNIAVGANGHPGESPFNALLTRGSARRFEDQLKTEVGEVLHQFDLLDRADASGDTISLGQAKRVAIGRAVQAGARVILLDEPLAGLDARGVESMVRLLERLVRSNGVTLVIVEHQLNHHFLKGLVRKQWLLTNGQLRQLSGHEATERAGDQVSFWSSALGSGVSVTLEDLSQGAVLLRMPPTGLAQHVGLGLYIRGLTVRRGTRLLFAGGADDARAGFDLRIAPGEAAVLLAPNGWGKTTLCEAVARTLTAAHGTIRPSARRIYYFAADSLLFPNLTAEEFLNVATADGSRLSMGMLELQRRRVGSLSGGERKQLHLSLLDSVPDGSVVVLDEPLASLDAVRTTIVLEKLRALRKRTTLLLLVPRHV